jgi:hypothetical protein
MDTRPVVTNSSLDRTNSFRTFRHKTKSPFTSLRRFYSSNVIPRNSQADHIGDAFNEEITALKSEKVDIDDKSTMSLVSQPLMSGFNHQEADPLIFFTIVKMFEH